MPNEDKFIDVSCTPVEVTLAPGEEASIQYVVTNRTGEKDLVRLVVPGDFKLEAKIDGDAEQSLNAEATATYNVKVKVPVRRTSGDEDLRMTVVAARDPDRFHQTAPAVRIVVASPTVDPAPPQKKPFPWWIVAVAGGAVVLVLGVVLAVVFWPKPKPKLAQLKDACGDLQCDSNLSCHEAVCLLTDTQSCNDDSECAGGHCVGAAADSKVCRSLSALGEACEQDDQCPSPSRCTGKVCLLTDGDECSADAQCSSKKCVQSACRTLPMDNGLPCSAANECKSGQCMSGMCASKEEPHEALVTQPCGANVTCVAPAKCVSGICLFDEGEGCASNDHCVTKKCIDGMCRPKNFSVSQVTQPCDAKTKICAEPASCVEGVCKFLEGAECNADLQCETTQCVGGVCKAYPFGLGERCRADRDCQSGNCESGTCQRRSNTPASTCFSNQAIAYAWAQEPTSAAYVASESYAYSASPHVKIRRSGTGVYSVDLGPVLDGAPNNVQVTAYGAPGDYCNIQSWGPGGANVRCYDWLGKAADAKFSILAFKAHRSLAKNVAFVWAQDENRASYEPSAAYRFNVGSSPKITRPGTGQYHVDVGDELLSRQANGKGVVLVTAYGSNRYCSVSKWRAGTVSISCYDPGGAAADSRFSLAVVNGDGAPGGLSTVYANSPSAEHYKPDNAFSAGTTVVTRESTGSYSVDFGKVGTGTTHVQLSNASGARCGINYWSSRGTSVNCRRPVPSLAAFGIGGFLAATNIPMDSDFTAVMLSSCN